MWQVPAAIWVGAGIDKGEILKGKKRKEDRQIREEIKTGLRNK